MTSQNIIRHYNTEAIAVIDTTIQFYTHNEIIKAVLFYNNKPIVVSDMTYPKTKKQEIICQHLNDVISVLEVAIANNIKSIEIAYQQPLISGYLARIPKDNTTALAYVQELNLLSKKIDFVLTPLRYAAPTRFYPLLHNWSTC